MKYSHRIFYYFLKDDVLFDRILEWVHRERKAIDEIVLFFDETCSSYRTPEKIAEEAMICKRRMEQLREAGIKSVGINILATVGHRDEAWSWLEMPPFQTAVDPYGKISFGQMCMRDERSIEFMLSKYRAVANTAPDFIWVDDDLRVAHHVSANCPCFCDRCVGRFNKIAGTGYRRDTLVEALKNPDNTTLRTTWLNYNLDAYTNLLTLIRKEVNKISTKIKFGLMTVHIQENTKMLCNTNALVDALGAEMIRPGGGFYQDYRLLDMIQKICGVAYQNTVMDKVPLRMYEMEDFPATVPHKSVRTHITESTMALMVGCDGIMTNSMPPCEGTAPIYEAFAANRDCLDVIAKRMRQTKLAGARPAFSPDLDIYIQSNDWFTCCAAKGEGDLAREEGERIFDTEAGFCYMGLLPFTTPSTDDAWITLLSGEVARALSDADIEKILSRGVFMDGAAAAILYQRNFGELIGCTPGTIYDNGLAEFYLEHPLNGDIALERRDTRMTYENKNVSMSLIPSEGAEPIARLVSVTGVELGIADLVFENKLGGRVAVMGYDPWRWPTMWHRKRQLHRIFRWLWNGHAPYEGIEAPSIFQLYRESSDKTKVIFMFTNLWEGCTGDMEISLAHVFPGKFCIYKGRGKFEEIPESDIHVKENRQIIRIPSLETHEFIVVMND